MSLDHLISVEALALRPPIKARPPSHTQLGDRQKHDMLARHPVVMVLPDEARAALMDHGLAWRGRSGHRLANESVVRFVCDGVLGLTPGESAICVGLCGPGMTLGWEYGFSDGAGEAAMVLIDAAWVEAPAELMTETLGQAWMERVFARNAVGRMKLIEAEAQCNARHMVSQRLAKWVLRLHRIQGEPAEIRVTQSALALLIGVQRTTVNAASRALQKDGILRSVRGRLVVQDKARLQGIACECAAL